MQSIRHSIANFGRTLQYTSGNAETTRHATTQRVKFSTLGNAEQNKFNLSSKVALAADFAKTHPAGQALSVGLAMNVGLIAAQFFIPGCREITLYFRGGATVGTCVLGVSSGRHPYLTFAALAGLAASSAVLPPLYFFVMSSFAVSTVIVDLLIEYLNAIPHETEKRLRVSRPRKLSDTTDCSSLVSVPHPQVGHSEQREGPLQTNQGPEITPDQPSPGAMASFKKNLTLKTENATGVFSQEYRKVGLQRLARLSDDSKQDDSNSNYAWLLRFDKLLETLVPISCDTKRRLTLQKDLARKLESIVGNEEIKIMLADLTNQQMLSGNRVGADSDSDGLIICIAGDSGTGKTRIAKLVGELFTNTISMTLPNVALKILAGASPSFQNAEPSEITKQMCQNPSQYTVLHLDEIDQVKPEAQAALLSLLEPSNTFVDQYFGLPINKSRLITICTMKADAITAKLAPDIWNRLRDCTVRTSPLSQSALTIVAKNELERRLSVLEYAQDTHYTDLYSMATEIVAAVPVNSPARSIVNIAKILSAKMGRMIDEYSLPTRLDATFVARSIHKTWFTGFNAKVSRCNENRTAHGNFVIDPVIVLYAYVRVNDIMDGTMREAPIRWAIPLTDDWMLRVSCAGEVLDLQMRRRDGLQFSVPTNSFYLLPPVSPLEDINGNEFFPKFPQDCLRKRSTEDVRNICATNLSTDLVEKCASRITQEWSVITIPVKVRDNFFTLNESLPLNLKETVSKSCSNGYLKLAFDAVTRQSKSNPNILESLTILRRPTTKEKPPALFFSHIIGLQK